MNAQCPRCGRQPVTRLHSSTHALYCQCPGCGYIWEQEDDAGRRPRPGLPQRRRSDFTRIARHADECETCRHLAAQLLELTKRLDELQAENAYLRQASQAFGDLAERLNQMLKGRRRPDDQRE